MTKQTFVIEITVDENNIGNLYSNFNINWDSPQEFINHLVDNFKEGELTEDGYSVRVLTRDEAKVRDLDLDKPRKTFEDYNKGDLVIYDGEPYQICDIDEEDQTFYICDDKMLDNGIWVDAEEII